MTKTTFKVLVIGLFLVIFSVPSLLAGRNNKLFELDLIISPSMSTILTGQHLHRPHFGMSYGMKGSYINEKMIYSVGLIHLQHGGNTFADSTSKEFKYYDMVKTVAIPAEINFEILNRKLTKLYINAGVLYGWNYLAMTINKKTKFEARINQYLRNSIPKSFVGVSVGVSYKIFVNHQYRIDISPTLLYQVNGIAGDQSYKSNLLTFLLTFGVLRVSSN